MPNFTKEQLDWLNTLSKEDQAKYKYDPATYKPSTSPKNPKKNKPTGPTGPKAPTPDQYLGNLPNPGNVLNDVLGKLNNFTGTNPDTSSARDYINRMLTGGVGAGSQGPNAWENDLYDDIGNTTPNDELAWLRDYIGKAMGPGGSGISSSTGRGGGGGYTRDAHGVLVPPANSGGGVPDTVGNSNSFFAQKIKELFDPARLDPANDPTMQPTIQAMRRENSEDILAAMQDLTARAEEGGAYGSGLYQAMAGKAREEGIESLDSAIAGLLHGAREGALGRQMDGLGMTNTRDIAAMQDATNRYGIDASERSAGAGAAAAAADAAEGRRLQAMNMLLGGKMDILGLRGNMANMRQGGQQGAMQGGMGLGEMGMRGLGMQADIGSNVLGSLLGYNQQQNQYDLGRRGIGVQRGQLDLANRQWQDQVGQDSLNSLLNIIMGIGGMGGTNNAPGQYIPSGPDPLAAMLMGGLGGWMQGGGRFDYLGNNAGQG